MRRWIITFIGLAYMAAASAMPSTAESVPVCKGNDLMEKMRTELPGMYSAVMAEAKAVPNHQAVLWRIDGAEHGKPSWLLGTIHLSDDRVTALTPATAKAISSVDTVALEIAGLKDKAKLTQQAMGNPGLIVLPPEESLWDHVDKKVQAEVVSRLQALGLPKAQAARLQPWLPAIMLSVSPCQTKRAMAGLAGLDQAVETQALAQGKKVVGLETITEQLGAMSSMTLKSQAAFLVSSVKLYEQIDDYHETMIQRYLKREVTALMPFLQAHMRDSTTAADIVANEEFLETLVVKRNHTMAERAKPLLDKQSLLIAVGALHLPGEDGLVALIRKQGFQVTAID